MNTPSTPTIKLNASDILNFAALVDLGEEEVAERGTDGKSFCREGSEAGEDYQGDIRRQTFKHLAPYHSRFTQAEKVLMWVQTERRGQAV